MPMQLLSLDGGTSILLDKPILLLGRHQECDIQIESRKISRRHCCIAQVDNTLMIRDLESTNGIRVNGERVREARLALGDEVIIGNSRFRVASDAEVAPSPGPVQAGRNRGAGSPRGPVTPDHTVDEDVLLESSEVPVAIDESAVTARPGEQVEDSGETFAADGAILPSVLNLAPSGQHPKQPNKL